MTREEVFTLADDAELRNGADPRLVQSMLYDWIKYPESRDYAERILITLRDDPENLPPAIVYGTAQVFGTAKPQSDHPDTQSPRLGTYRNEVPELD